MNDGESLTAASSRTNPLKEEITDMEKDADAEDASDQSFKSLSDSDSDEEIKNKKSKKKKKEHFRDKPDNPFACPMKGCKTRLKKQTDLKFHFILHLENNPFACPIPGCAQKLSDQWFFKRHLQCHMRKNDNSCGKCGQTYSRPDKLKNHKCLLNPPKRMKKTIAMREEEVNACLRSHYVKLKEKGHLLGDVPEDGKINLDFKPQIDFNAIIKTDLVYLQVCKNNPSFRDQIFASERIPMKNGKFYKCESCEFTSSSLERLKGHYRVKHISRPWACEKCGSTFTREMYLEEHLKFHESTGNNVYVNKLEDGKYECTKCKFTSKYEFSVKRHWLIVHKITVPSHAKVLPEIQQDKRKNASTSAESLKQFSPGTTSGESEMLVGDEFQSLKQEEFHEPIEENVEAAINIKPESESVEMILPDLDEVNCASLVKTEILSDI